MEKTTPYSKRFAALVTDLTDRYQQNPYTQSTVNVIALQITLSLILVGFLVLSFAIEHAQVVNMLQHSSTTEAYLYGTKVAPSYSLIGSALHVQTLIIISIGIIIFSSIFGYLSAQYALRPTRDSLKYQKRFIGNIAHELRTPLAIMKTGSEVALMEPDLTENSAATFTTTLGEINRMSETINNLLSFDSLVRPAFIKTKPMHLPTVLSTVVERHQTLARGRGIDLSLSTPESAYILGNSTAIEQVFTNLIKNALNYTPEHSNQTVKVSLSIKEGDEILVTVADTGIGIAQNDLFHVFEPFYRGDTSRTRGVGSGTSGLGLAIVHEIVRMHQGTIVIRSALNRGTTVEIKLPGADTTAYVQELASSNDDELHEITG
jgi:signal transduction histidine kinase